MTGAGSLFRDWSLAWRFAIREMRGGLSGFRIFILCILLGTAAIAGVNSVAASMSEALEGRGREILAGDIRFELKQREANTAERAYLDSLGEVAVASNMRSMVRSEDKTRQTLSELKAVDGLYPLYGAFVADPDRPLAELLAERDGVYGALAQPMLLDRLGGKVGDRVLIGDMQIEIRGRIVSEPDQLSDGFAFAPRLLIARDALVRSGLMQTGSLVDNNYRIKLPAGAKSNGEIRREAQAKFPEAGWAIRGSGNAAPALSNNIERFSEFLTLVGLAALAAGGVGVANAVTAYLDAKRGVIACFKSLGAPGRLIVMVYLIQILLIATLAIIGGLAVGAAITPVVGYFLKGYMPAPEGLTLYPRALGLATLFGLLITLAFSILPLGRSRLVRATELFRSQSETGWRVPARYYIAAGAVFMAVAALAVFSAEQRFLAFVFVASTASAFLVLRLVAVGVAALARRVRQVRSPALRLAIGNIHRPGALTSSVILSLGLGLTLLSALALIEGNLRGSLAGAMAEKAPNFFFIDIQNRDIDGFRNVVKTTAPNGDVGSVPMLRGRILAFNGEDVQKRSVPQEARWVLQGDRGITYSETVPENSRVEEGAWWDKDYSGEPLVSFASEEGRQLGLKIGDTVTVNVLGRNITARIANFREVEWRSMSINFVMVFSPNTFKGAPHAWLATLTDHAATPADEQAVMRSVTNAYPGITSIRVKDALDIASNLVGQLATAVRAAASIALVVSVLVLSGAIAAGNRARIHDAVVLKTLGARRSMLTRAYFYEYALLGLSASIFALAAASVASWYVVTEIMELPFRFLPGAALWTLAVALVVTAGTGFLGTWRVLGQKAAPVLREL
ncbi:ABC transporter permease [Rhizobium sp. TRM95796]|uniref:ABC transporter permease n=1 Tax=Rhizobium sp. TRM95796 TaxID=2979862 RepID=UPI0021E86B74|nr:ABC transporter permease [Rhizobium sp. TRM95796]MCV3767363.1 ABC transporter permease [Rhizobium sp. TRM95796]